MFKLSTFFMILVTSLQASPFIFCKSYYGEIRKIGQNSYKLTQSQHEGQGMISFSLENERSFRRGTIEFEQTVFTMMVSGHLLTLDGYAQNISDRDAFRSYEVKIFDLVSDDFGYDEYQYVRLVNRRSKVISEVVVKDGQGAFCY